MVLMRVGIYARVSTRDKDQNPETQLVPLREFVAAQQSWFISGEFVDYASAVDLKARIAWRDLLDQASKRRFDLVLIWRLDRAFRSVLDAATTLERFRAWGIGLRSYGEPWLDTTSPFGEALYYITAAYAQLSRGILSERVRAGMARARQLGVKLGRPGGTHAIGFRARWREVELQVRSGQLSKSAAARTLGVGRATISRLLAAGRMEAADDPNGYKRRLL